MKKIYLLLCFYLLKIDFCGMNEAYNNQNIIQDLIKFQGQSDPVKIIRPVYQKSLDGLFKVRELSFEGRDNNFICENNLGDQLGQNYNSFLDFLKEKEDLFLNKERNVSEEFLLGERKNENNKDNNESNNVGCCCFVSSQRFYELRKAYKTSSDENENLKKSGRDLLKYYRDYSSNFYGKYKQILVDNKEKERSIETHKEYEKDLKNQIVEFNKKYKDLLDYDKGLENAFQEYDRDYTTISTYYTQSRNLAEASIQVIQNLQGLLQQEKDENSRLNSQYTSSLQQKEHEITNLKNNNNSLLVEKDNQIEALKFQITALQQEKKSLASNLEHISTMFQKQNEEKIELKEKFHSLQQEYRTLQTETLRLNTQYNKDLQSIDAKYKELLQLYTSNFTQSSNDFSYISQNLERLNSEWSNSFNSLNEIQGQNMKLILNLNIDSNNKIQESLNKAINDFLVVQKNSIDNVNKVNSDNLNTILSLYKTTIDNFKEESKTILQILQQQNNELQNVVNSSNLNLNTNVTQQTNNIITNISELTESISKKLQSTQDALTIQNDQIKTINIKINQTENTIIEKISLLKTENEKNNSILNCSLKNLQENIEKSSEEKQKLLDDINTQRNSIEALNQEKQELLLKLQKKEQEYDSLQENYKSLENNYSQLQKEIKKIGDVLKVNDKNQGLNTIATFQTHCIKTKIQELQEKNAKGDVLRQLLQNTNKDLNEKQTQLNNEIFNLSKEKCDATFAHYEDKIKLLSMQYSGNNQFFSQGGDKKQFQTAIDKIKKDLQNAFQESVQVATLKNKNSNLEQKVREQEEQLKATASGFDLMEQQEYDNFSNKMRQDHIREILNKEQIGREMITNSDDKNKNEILKEEYYLPFIFEDYNINDNWVCLNKSGLAKYNKSLYNTSKALISYGFVCSDKYVFNSLRDVCFNRLDSDYDYRRGALKNMLAEKNMVMDMGSNNSNEVKYIYSANNKKICKDYYVFVRGNSEDIVLGREICEKAAHILDNLPGAELYLVFYKNKKNEHFCSFYVKQIPLQQFMEYCAFVQGCSLYSRLYSYGEYLSMFLNNIITGSAAIERSLFSYFTKEDLQSIFATLFSNRWYVGHDIANPACEGDFIPKDVLSYPELLIKPLNKNEYAESKNLDKILPHPFVDDVINTKEKRYKGKTVFWYKCDMQDPISYCLSECIGLGNYGYIGRFYKRDGQGNYYPVALKVTLDSVTHAGGSHEAIMKEIKAGKAAAVMGCNRMIYSNKAGLINLKNPNFCCAKIGQANFANIFLNPLFFIEDEKKMQKKNSNLQLGDHSGFQKLLLSKKDCQDVSAICYRMGEGSTESEMWEGSIKKQTVDYNYRIDFLINKFNNFYNSENFKKFGNLMFNSANKVENPLLYVMEMDIIEDKDDDLYTDVTEEEKIVGNSEQNEDNGVQNEDNNSIDISDNIKNTINNIAEYLTAQQKCGVIHGDIKAKNMTKNKFLDFGSFDMVTNYLFHPDFSDVVGTPEYWDLVRIFNRQLNLLEPYNVLLCDYQLSDLYASFVSLYYYMFKAYPAFATLIIIIKSILKHYVNDKDSNKYFLGEEMSYEEKITDFIANFPLGNELVKCTKAFEKDRKLKKQAKKDNNNNNDLNVDEIKYLLKFNKYLKDVEDKNYLSNEVKQLRYCIFKIIQESLLTVKDTKKQVVSDDKEKLFFIMSQNTNFYSKGEEGFIEVEAFVDSDVVNKLIEIYKQLRGKELKNLEKLINSDDDTKKMLGRIMFQILQQGTFANSEKYPAYNVYINEHSYNGIVKGNEDYRKKNLTYKSLFNELKNKIRAKDKTKLEAFLNTNADFLQDYNIRLNLHKDSYLYTLEPLSIKSLISQQPYYKYEKSFINTINEEKKNI